MDTTLVLAVFGGVLCGAAGVGSLTVGFLWWQSYRRTELLRSSLNPLPPQATSPLAPPSPAVYQRPPAPAYREYLPPASVPSPAPSGPAPSPYAPPAPAPAGVGPGSVWLDGIGGMVNGQRINIHKDETLLGRSGVCDVQFHDPKVSRQHALLRRYNEQYYLYDMQSSGGTFVNGQRIESAVLHDQDQVRMGDSVVVFRQG